MFNVSPSWIYFYNSTIVAWDGSNFNRFGYITVQKSEREGGYEKRQSERRLVQLYAAAFSYSISAFIYCAAVLSYCGAALSCCAAALSYCAAAYLSHSSSNYVEIRVYVVLICFEFHSLFLCQELIKAL